MTQANEKNVYEGIINEINAPDKETKKSDSFERFAIVVSKSQYPKKADRLMRAKIALKQKIGSDDPWDVIKYALLH